MLHEMTYYAKQPILQMTKLWFIFKRLDKLIRILPYLFIFDRSRGIKYVLILIVTR